MTTKFNHSICVFGSHSRGSKDKYSDKDIMVVAQQHRQVEQLVKDYKNKGWSVAFFTWKRLEAMSKAGSLFLQHLKLEGEIIRDDAFKLTEFLTNFSPKSDYSEDFSASLDMFRPVERTVVSRDAAACMGDVLYTFVRNGMILKLASQEIYHFGFETLLNEYVSQNLISKNDAATMNKLRLLKASYRSRNFGFVNANEIFMGAKSITRKMFGLNYKSVSAYSDLRYFVLPYATLREIEVCLVSEFGISNLDAATDRNIRELWEMICDPRAYSWKTKKLSREYINSLNLEFKSFREQRKA